MDIHDATAAYESWLAGLVPLHAGDLAYKHAKMADRGDPFPFLRGTYYRWATQWPAVCPELAAAPRVLAVGDLHVENYGTWRDADGRLCWGVNDFDEADELAYPHDLVRLATSVRFARPGGHLSIRTGAACDAILDGYRYALTVGGTPFVLEERHSQLRAVATDDRRWPKRFWDDLTALAGDPEPTVPAAARAAIDRDWPGDVRVAWVRHRPRAGVGSLGKPRFVAVAEWAGGWVAREAKAVTPPATAWVGGSGSSRAAEALGRAVRCPDPFYRPGPAWVCRRLAPKCSRVELGALGEAVEFQRVLHAMGAEVANVHLGTAGAAGPILADLRGRPIGWLKSAARAMSEVVEVDWTDWRAGWDRPD